MKKEVRYEYTLYKDKQDEKGFRVDVTLDVTSEKTVIHYIKDGNSWTVEYDGFRSFIETLQEAGVGIGYFSEFEDLYSKIEREKNRE